jgi:hypothetical protein
MAPEEYARDSHATDAAVERFWSHTVGIVNRALTVEGTDPASGLPACELEAPGTAVAGAWGKHHFVVTARHVLEQASVRDLSFFCRPSGALRHGSEIGMQDAMVGVRISDPTATIHRCGWEDIALVTLQPDLLGTYLEFVDLAACWADPHEKQSVYGLGYPASSGFIFGRQVGQSLQKAVLLAPFAFGGAVLASSTGTNFRDFDSNRHYLIPYDAAAHGQHPKGISGAAVWLQCDDKQIVWTAKFNFAGICTSAYRNRSIEQIVKASVVRRFLNEVFGDAGEAA